MELVALPAVLVTVRADVRASPVLLHIPGPSCIVVPGATWSAFKHTVLLSLPRGFAV